MPRLQDISESPARRAFLVMGDDSRLLIKIEADTATFPDAATEHDIMGELYKDWQPTTGLVNKDIGDLLISIGGELRGKPELTHLDGEKPTV